MEIWAIDLNQTASAFPDQMRTLMESLQAAGHQVHIVSGWEAESAGEEALAVKTQQLQDLGLGHCYDKLVVVADPDNDVAAQKVNYMRHVGATTLVDNNRRNCKKAIKAGFMALRPQGTPPK